VAFHDLRDAVFQGLPGLRFGGGHLLT
jgi:hypothetical protein